MENLNLAMVLIISIFIAAIIIIVVNVSWNQVNIFYRNIRVGNGHHRRVSWAVLKEGFADFLIQLLLVCMIPVALVWAGVLVIMWLWNAFSMCFFDCGEFNRDFSLGGRSGILDIFNTLVSQDKVHGDVSVSVAEIMICGCIKHSHDKKIISVSEAQEHFRELIKALHVTSYPTSKIIYYNCKVGKGELTIGYPSVQVNEYKYENENCLNVRFRGKGQEFRKLTKQL